MLNALRRMNDMDVRDPRQTLGYHGGSYRNLAREFFCLSPLVEDEAHTPRAVIVVAGGHGTSCPSFLAPHTGEPPRGICLIAAPGGELSLGRRCAP